MKLSAKLLQTMALAVAGIGISGCEHAKSPPNPNGGRSIESGVEEVAAPTPDTEGVCLPDNCPACGRG